MGAADDAAGDSRKTTDSAGAPQPAITLAAAISAGASSGQVGTKTRYGAFAARLKYQLCLSRSRYLSMRS